MRAAIFDLETNGLLPGVTTVHCLVIKVIGGPTYRCNDQPDNPDGMDIRQGVDYLLDFVNNGGELIAHNGIKFDSEVIKKLFGVYFPWHKVHDTMVLAAVLWPEVAIKDALRKGFPRNLIGNHSLEAWGHRLGIFKGDYDGGWEQWSQEMEDYCVQDVEVTHALWNVIEKAGLDPRCSALERQVAHIIGRQERYGFLFNEAGAQRLYATLIGKREELTHRLREVFGPLYRADGKVFLPKRDNKSSGYVAGAAVQKVKLAMFDAGNRHHIAYWLKVKRGWVPKEHTENGQPKIDEQVIAALKYPEAPLLTEYLMVEKRIGQIAEGKEAWLKHVQPDGRIHGRVYTNGAVTGRMTHSKPNMGQVPGHDKPYGHDCRALFTVPKGKRLVGADADALELRDLAGYMAKYDDGAYIETVLRGDKAAGTDMHSVNARAIGLDPKGTYPTGTGRNVAKTFFYAFLYGAGDQKLGMILTGKRNAKAAGAKGKDALLTNLPALGKLVNAVKLASKKGYLIGLDGRRIPVRSEHAALNTLLQSAGAIQMKKALCILDDKLQEAGLIPGVAYEFVANVHDEWQIEVDEDKHEVVGDMAVAAIREAGEALGFRCPLEGQWCAGLTWAETH